MAENSKIEWTDHTFNPWRGCTKVSPGCKNCYAETLSHRNPKVLGEWGKGKPRVKAASAMWKQPLKWNKQATDAWNKWEASRAANTGQAAPPPHRPRVFCASLADWLDDEVSIDWLADLLELIHHTPNLDWLLLTKRPQNWLRRIGEVYIYARPSLADWIEAWIGHCPPANVWLGTSVEDQQRANERIPELLKIPAKVRFLSCEPLLAPVNLTQYQCGETRHEGGTFMLFGDALRGFRASSGWSGVDGGPRIHWVIAGGESGPDARPMHPDWARGLRDQCAAAGVPFLFKQWGEWQPFHQGTEYTSGYEGKPIIVPNGPGATGWPVYKVGKKKAGRTLDGRIYHEFPQR